MATLRRLLSTRLIQIRRPICLRSVHWADTCYHRHSFNRANATFAKPQIHPNIPSRIGENVNSEVKRAIRKQRFQLERHVKRSCAELRARVEKSPAETVLRDWEETTRGWIHQIQSTVKTCALESTIAASVERHLMHEIEIGFESAIAICMKRRKFGVANKLFTLLLDFYPILVPTDATFTLRMHEIGFRYTALYDNQATLSTKELKKWTTQGKSISERDVVQLLLNEDRPHYLQSHLERNRVRHNIVTKVESVLRQYKKLVVPIHGSYVTGIGPSIAQQFSLKQINVSDLTDTAHSIHPYISAIQLCARNTVPFNKVLQLSTYAKSIAFEQQNIAQLFIGLLDSARWNEILLVLKKFREEIGKFDVQHTESTKLLLQLWSVCMKSIHNSYTDRYSQRILDILPSDIEELRTIFHGSDQYFSNICVNFEKFPLQYKSLCELRLKAASVTGSFDTVQKILDECIQEQNISIELFTKACEIYSVVPIQLRNISFEEVIAQSYTTNTPNAQETEELEKTLENIGKCIIPTIIEKYREESETLHNSHEMHNIWKLEKLQLDSERQFNRYTQRAQQLADKITKLRGYDGRYVHVQQILDQADQYIATILDRWRESHSDQDMNSKLQVAVMKQYFSCVNRIGKRLNTHKFNIASHIMHRVFQLLDQFERQYYDCNIPYLQWKVEMEPIVKQLYWYASRTASITKFPSHLDEILQRKYQLIANIVPSKQHKKSIFQVDEYDLLLYAYASRRMFVEAYDLFQEIQNHGLVPSSDIIHTMVRVQLSTLSLGSNTSINEYFASEDDEFLEGEEVIEPIDNDSRLPYSGKHQLPDVVDFLINQYNISQVRPYAKTSRMVFDRLIQANDICELKRFINSLRSMGAMNCSLQLWLELCLKTRGLSIESMLKRN